MGESGKEDKRPSSSDWRSTWLGSASLQASMSNESLMRIGRSYQISSSYAFVLNFSDISEMKRLYLQKEGMINMHGNLALAYMVESMLRETRKIMNQSPMAALLARS